MADEKANDPSALNPKPAQTVPNAVPQADRSGGDVPRRSGVITNPPPVTDAEATVTPPEGTDPAGLPAGTRAEMEAGQQALERNQPKPAAPTNPVDDLNARKSDKTV